MLIGLRKGVKYYKTRIEPFDSLRSLRVKVEKWELTPLRSPEANYAGQELRKGRLSEVKGKGVRLRKTELKGGEKRA